MQSSAMDPGPFVRMHESPDDTRETRAAGDHASGPQRPRREPTARTVVVGTALVATAWAASLLGSALTGWAVGRRTPGPANPLGLVPPSPCPRPGAAPADAGFVRLPARRGAALAELLAAWDPDAEPAGAADAAPAAGAWRPATGTLREPQRPTSTLDAARHAVALPGQPAEVAAAAVVFRLRFRDQMPTFAVPNGSHVDVRLFVGAAGEVTWPPLAVTLAVPATTFRRAADDAVWPGQPADSYWGQMAMKAVLGLAAHAGDATALRYPRAMATFAGLAPVALPLGRCAAGPDGRWASPSASLVPRSDLAAGLALLAAVGGTGGLSIQSATALTALPGWDADAGRARLAGAWLRGALGGAARRLTSDDGSTDVLLDTGATLALIGAVPGPLTEAPGGVAAAIAYSGHGAFFDAGLLANTSLAWDPLRAAPALSAAEWAQLPARSVASVTLAAAWLPAVADTLYL